MSEKLDGTNAGCKRNFGDNPEQQFACLDVEHKKLSIEQAKQNIDSERNRVTSLRIEQARRNVECLEKIIVHQRDFNNELLQDQIDKVKEVFGINLNVLRDVADIK